MKEKFYLTTAIAYTSSKPHIGNVFEIVLTDAIARFRRMQGYDVFFLTGTDEHGIKIQQKAEAKGVTPKQYVDEVAGEIRRMWDLFGASYDKFIRTTDEYHEKAVSKIFTKLYEQGDIYKSSYEGWYCTPCESFWTESQAVDGCCPDCGAKLTKSHEEAYFLRLSKYADRLIEYYEQNPDFITPVSRRNEMINNFIKPGLQDLCVSRSTFTWGVPVEFDPKHVIYVWIDALSNYITAIGYDPDHKSELYNKLWPADLHVIGKDIVRFHTIYWPIILMALGEPLPKKVLGHPWLLMNNDKMSKSKGNMLYGDDLVRMFGLDAIRYYLLSEMGYQNDGNISYDAIISRTNIDLANIYGNLVSRTASMIKQYFGGIIPAPSANEEVDTALIETVRAEAKAAYDLLDKYYLSDAATHIIALLKACNKYIDDTTPWMLAKDESKRERLQNVMAYLVEGIRTATTLFTPYMPTTAENVAKLFGFDTSLDKLADFKCDFAGNTVGECGKLFARIDKGEEILEQLKEIALQEHIKLASVSALGAINDFTVGVFKTAEKKYDANEFQGYYEITSLTGTITTKDGEYYAHLHMSAGNEKGEVFGGHLNRAIVSATCEMVITVINGTVERRFEEEVGLNLFQF